MAKLLVMVASLIDSNSPAVAATHAEATFRFLLPALDIRQTHLNFSEAGDCSRASPIPPICRYYPRKSRFGRTDVCEKNMRK